MGKLRHIAIQCTDPEAVARFYVDVFDMTEMSRIGIEGDGGGAIYLSDGTINMAILRILDPEFPNFLPMGLNHIGFVVDDLDAVVAKATEYGARTLRTGYEIEEGAHWEHKMVSPDGVGIDLYDVNGRGWPGISALEDLGIKGATDPDAHTKGLALASGN